MSQSLKRETDKTGVERSEPAAEKSETGEEPDVEMWVGDKKDNTKPGIGVAFLTKLRIVAQLKIVAPSVYFLFIPNVE